MKLVYTIFLSFLSSIACSQRAAAIIDSTWYIGTWELKKIADKGLNYTNRKFKPEIIHFTKDSVFVIINSLEYAGTWQLLNGQPNIKISSTNKFNYYWISRGENKIFFKTKEMNYSKFFVRTIN